MNKPSATIELAKNQTWPLTEAQTGLWYAQQLDPTNPCFNTGHALWLQGALDLTLFEQAANQAAQEAQALQLIMHEGEQTIMQTIDPARTPLLQIVDVSAHTNPAEAARAAMQADMTQPLNPTRDILALQQLYLLGENQFVWYQRAHHLCIDGYGMELWESRVASLYNAAYLSKNNQHNDETASTANPTKTISSNTAFGDLSKVFLEDKNYLESEKRLDDAAFWKQAFAAPDEVVGLSNNTTIKAEPSESCIYLHKLLNSTWREKLLDLSKALNTPWPDILTALTGFYCQKMAAVTQTTIGIPYMGRLGSASSRVPAMVMNVLPLLIHATPEQTLQDFLKNSAKEQIKARRHGRYRSEQLRRDLGLLGGTRRLYGAIINVQPFYKELHIEGLKSELEILGTGPVNDITIGFRGDAVQTLDLEIEANPKLYSKQEVQSHLERIETFLQAAFDAKTLAEITLASPAEFQRFVFDVNRTHHLVAKTTLPALIEDQIKRSPQAPAVEFEGQIISYAELEQKTRALAQALQQRGVGADTLVAVALPRSIDLIVALLAIQRAGGAYLPLDLKNPIERLERIVSLSSPLLGLANSQDEALLPKNLFIFSTNQWPTVPEPTQLKHQAKPEDLAYVIYTSGSTGEPKGVMIEQQAIVNRLEWMRQHYHIDSSDRILQKTPFTFDVSVWEFFLPLMSGATLVIAPPEAHRDPAWLSQIIRKQAITTCHFVPSMLALFLAEPSTHNLAIKRVFTSGEELPAPLRNQFHTSIKGELHNLYGPTEAAVDVSYWPASSEDNSQPVPIGFPVWNTSLYILDAQLNPVPANVTGDLYLGGMQLARGYLGRKDLTEAAFIPSPFNPNERIYKTGDLARWRDDGAVQYIGRSDDQVKLRGLRIELGDIKAAMMGSGLAKVIVKADRLGDKRLVAYFQPNNPEEAFDTRKLQQFVATKVPNYMVPSAFVPLQDWPVTANGKLDQKALPKPELISAEGRELETPTEKQLAQIYANMLAIEVERINAASDFFSLGGDSLSAVRLLSAIQEQWNINLGLGALFSNPDIASLAAQIDNEEVSFNDGLAPLIQLGTAKTSEAPLFVIHPAGGICWCYRSIARAISRPSATNFMPSNSIARGVFGLQAPALSPDVALPNSIEALAEDYVNRILAIQPDAPIHLLGWSVGGIIAQAMAVNLQRRNIQPGLVALLDAYPAEVWRNEPEPTPLQALRALIAIAGYDPDNYAELDSRDKVIAFLKQSDSALGLLPEPALEGVVRVVTDTNRLIREHHHQYYEGVLTHIRAAKDHAHKPHLKSDLWAAYTKELVCLDVPFLHSQLTSEQACAIIAPQLRFEA